LEREQLESHWNGGDNDCHGNVSGSGDKSMGMVIELWEWEWISIAAFHSIIWESVR